MREPCRVVRRLFATFSCLFAAMTAVSAEARDIPVTIYWSDTKPDRVSVQTVGGVTDFYYDAAAKAFKSAVPIEAGEVAVRTLFVTYAGKNYPLYLKVNSFLSDIGFRLSMKPANSCLNRLVKEVDKTVDNLPDAMRSVLQAGQLLTIESPDDCGALAPRVHEARYKRTVQLAQLSNGLFQTSPKLKNEYLASVPTASRRRVEAEVAEYENEIDSLEAVQLVATRKQAQDQRDFDKAAAINDVLLQRAQSDEQLETLYKQQGVTINQLEKDGRYLDARAATIRQPDSSGP